MKNVVIAAGLSLLGGCAWLSPAPVVEPAGQHWVCDSQATFDWRYLGSSQQQVQLSLGGSPQVYTLTAGPGASDGVLFSDGVLAFNKRGAEGLLYWVATNDLIGRGCKAP